MNPYLIKTKCACCGKAFVLPFAYCPICGWANDDIQNENEDFEGGENLMSLKQAKQAYAEGRKIE